MELLIRVVDKRADNSIDDLCVTKRGDVIAARPEGAGWGVKELENPEWRIVLVRGLKDVEAEALTSTEIPVNIPAEQALLRKRGMSLDLSQLPALPTKRGTIAGKTHDVEVSVGQLRSVKTVKTPTRRPDVLGPGSDVIGK